MWRKRSLQQRLQEQQQKSPCLKGNRDIECEMRKSAL